MKIFETYCQINSTSKLKEQTDIAVIKIRLVEKVRACPICPNCGSKKFDRIKAEDTVVKCVNCGKELKI